MVYELCHLASADTILVSTYESSGEHTNVSIYTNTHTYLQHTHSISVVEANPGK